MWTELVSLFTDMGWVSAVLLTIGIIFAIVEVFTPGLGVAALVSAVCVVGGIVARMIEGGNFTQLLILIFMLLIFFLVVFLLMVRSAKYGLLSKSPIVECGTAVPKNYALEECNPLFELKGKIAKSLTTLRPAGKIVIDGSPYEAMADKGYIEKNVEVEIIGVDGMKLTVKKI